MTPVHLIDYNFLFLDNKIVSEYIFKENKVITNYDLYNLSLVISKPDSSKSDFSQYYNKYLATGMRRHYAYYKDFEKYINKK